MQKNASTDESFITQPWQNIAARAAPLCTPRSKFGPFSCK